MDIFEFISPQFLAIFIACVCFLGICELILKGFALWKAGRNNHKAWFVCIFIINTAGVLPLIYLLLHRSKKD